MVMKSCSEMIPTRRDWRSTTGRQLIFFSFMIRMASNVEVSGVTVVMSVCMIRLTGTGVWSCWVRFSATGALHNETVRVRVGAWDGAAAGKPDRFSIRCTNGTGDVVLEAEGHLFRGDIVVGAAD